MSFSYRIPGVGVSPEHGIGSFEVTAGDAVRAEVTTAEGTSSPALLVDHTFWGWYPGETGATITGYAADGSVVGSEYLGRGSSGIESASEDGSLTSEPRP